MSKLSLVQPGTLPTLTASWPLLAKGFRPFFLLAALFAVGVVPLWLLVVGGVLHPGAYFGPSSWHAHEMVFGFTAAVVAGFLLTAVGNWTGRETAVGSPLALLCGLWIAGRVAVLAAPALPRGFAALVDLTFLPALGLILGRPLLATRNRRNLVMLAVLAALWAANGAMHADALVLAPGWQWRGSLVAVDVLVLLMVVITGRVLPMFTRNTTSVGSIRNVPSLDRLAIGACAAVIAVDLAGPTQRLWAVAATALAGLACAGRMIHWGTRHSARHPLLWILHAGCSWIAIGMLLRSWSALHPSVPSSPAVHALTLGAIGSLTLGMMARVSLGHTGRSLAVGRTVGWAFVLITLAAALRVVLPLAAPRWFLTSIVAAGALWTLAFALYLVVFVPVLCASRVDGKPG